MYAFWWQRPQQLQRVALQYVAIHSPRHLLNRHSTRTERRILLRVEAEDGAVRFTVADNGVGISPERQKSVWGRRTSGEGSSGLGLAFVRSIVDRLGGKVTLCSKVNEGTHITITIEEAAE